METPKKQKESDSTQNTPNKSNQKQKPQKCSGIVNFFNAVQVLTWFITFCSVISYTLSVHIPQLNEYQQDLKSFTILFTKIAQTTQISDILLSFARLLSNNPFFSLIQVSARLVTVWFFINEDIPSWLLASIVIPWSVGDTIRPLYNLIKTSKLLTWLRYTLFIINYPIGATSEVVLMELRLKEELFKDYEYPIRILQVLTFIGLAYLYKFLLSQRKKNLSPNNENEDKDK